MWRHARITRKHFVNERVLCMLGSLHLSITRRGAARHCNVQRNMQNARTFVSSSTTTINHAGAAPRALSQFLINPERVFIPPPMRARRARFRIDFKIAFCIVLAVSIIRHEVVQPSTYLTWDYQYCTMCERAHHRFPPRFFIYFLPPQ